MSLTKAFPTDFKPRKEQLDILGRAEEAWKTKKFVIVNAPTGVGKSLLAKTVANAARPIPPRIVELFETYRAFQKSQRGGYRFEEEFTEAGFNGAMALTITKSLQDQYQAAFDDLRVYKGKSNYVCDVDDELSVDIGPCVYLSGQRDECAATNRCPYYRSRNETLAAKFAALNYDLYLTLPGHVKLRQYLVCDEASELEDILVSAFSFTINYKQIKFATGQSLAPISKTNKERQLAWLNTLVDILEEVIEDYLDKLNRNPDNAANVRPKLVTAQRIHSDATKTISAWRAADYVLDEGQEHEALVPLRVNTLAGMLFETSEKVMLMSATIVDHQKFAQSLGIDENEYEYIEVPSPFDPSRSPIYVGKLKLNHKTMDSMLPTIVKHIKVLAKEHGDEKGIIHTHTNKITKYLQDHINDPRFIFREPGVSNEELIEAHEKSPGGSIVVSPSLTHGVDMKDDLARWQVIIKLPYYPLGSNRVKTLFDRDKRWYLNKMLSTLIQASGRGTRSKDDWCVTYILDGNFARVIQQAKRTLPRYFVDRVQ